MTTTEIKKAVMKGAWKRAQVAADYYGKGKKSDYFKDCLKFEWQAVKEHLAKLNEKLVVIDSSTETQGGVVEVKLWIIKKNLPSEDIIARDAGCRGEVLRETEKAVFVEFKVKDGYKDVTGKHDTYHRASAWFPKSQCQLVQNAV